MPQNIMRVLCAVIRQDHFKFASTGLPCRAPRTRGTFFAVHAAKRSFALCFTLLCTIINFNVAASVGISVALNISKQHKKTHLDYTTDFISYKQLCGSGNRQIDASIDIQYMLQLELKQRSRMATYRSSSLVPRIFFSTWREKQSGQRPIPFLFLAPRQWRSNQIASCE